MPEVTVANFEVDTEHWSDEVVVRLSGDERAGVHRFVGNQTPPRRILKR